MFALSNKDIHQLKTALNHLGYYNPDPQVGIEEDFDPAFKDAVEAFQRDNGLAGDGWVRPYDATILALNNAMRNKERSGQYIWRTVQDEKVRDGHAAREGQIFTWGTPPDGGHPGEDYNCRCWVEPVESNALKSNCATEKDRVQNADKDVKGLTARLNNLLLELDQLVKDNNALIKNAQKSLGVRIVAFILTLPFESLGILGELLRQFFVHVISEKLIASAESFMRQLWMIKQKIQHKRDQFVIVLNLLEKSSQELEAAREALKKCQKKQNP